MEAAVRAELDDLAKRDPKLAASSLALTALALAKELDHPGNSATSKSMCAKSMLDLQNRLRELAPADVEVTPLDEIRRRRDARLAKSAG